MFMLCSRRQYPPGSGAVRRQLRLKDCWRERMFRERVNGRSLSHPGWTTRTRRLAASPLRGGFAFEDMARNQGAPPAEKNLRGDGSCRNQPQKQALYGCRLAFPRPPLASRQGRSNPRIGAAFLCEPRSPGRNRSGRRDVSAAVGERRAPCDMLYLLRRPTEALPPVHPSCQEQAGLSAVCDATMRLRDI